MLYMTVERDRSSRGIPRDVVYLGICSPLREMGVYCK
jgi:hypothetical protein